MRSCKSWKSCTAAFTLLCKPRSGFRCQMECEKGRKALKPGLAWSECKIQYGAEVLTEEGRPGGTFLIFFACDSVGRQTGGEIISASLHKKTLLYQ